MHLKQIGHALKMYSTHAKGERFPPLAPYEEVWMLDIERLYPKYLDDLTVFSAPNRPGHRERAEALERLAEQEPIDWEAITRIAAEHFAYSPWAVNRPEDVPKVVEGRRTHRRIH